MYRYICIYIYIYIYQLIMRGPLNRGPLKIPTNHESSNLPGVVDPLRQPELMKADRTEAIMH